MKRPTHQTQLGDDTLDGDASLLSATACISAMRALTLPFPTKRARLLSAIRHHYFASTLPAARAAFVRAFLFSG
jgi:hypothetical protein